MLHHSKSMEAEERLAVASGSLFFWASRCCSYSSEHMSSSSQMYLRVGCVCVCVCVCVMHCNDIKEALTREDDQL